MVCIRDLYNIVKNLFATDVPGIVAARVLGGLRDLNRERCFIKGDLLVGDASNRWKRNRDFTITGIAFTFFRNPREL
jgi:hypothetical protein